MRRSVGVCAMAGMAHLGGTEALLPATVAHQQIRGNVQMFVVPKIQMCIKQDGL